MSTVTCEQCGAGNEVGESFCGSCGAYLGWAEESPDTGAAGPATPAPAAPTPAEAPPVAARPTGDALRSAGSASPLPTAPVPEVEAGAAPVAPATAAEAPSRAAPVQPGAPVARARRPDLTAEDRQPLPGETVCPACGAGNIPTRRFCRRCGADLVDAPVVAQLPWWRRRLISRPRRATPVAGSRPVHRARRAGRRRWPVVVLVLAVLGAGGWYARPWVVDTVGWALDRVAHEPVRASGFEASSAARGHPARAIGDTAPNAWWSPNRTGDAKGESVTLLLPEPVRLAYVTVYNGVTSQDSNAFISTARVHKLTLVVTREDGTTVEQELRLRDVTGAQPFHVGVGEATRVRLVIESAYGAKATLRVALGEVELVKRS